MSSQSNSRILFISLFAQPRFNRRYSTFLNRILHVASLEQAHRPIPALRAIAEDPQAIFITGEALATQRFGMVWTAVIRYVRHGGTAICMGSFGCKLSQDRYRAFFAQAGLPWDYDHVNQCRSVLNAELLPREISDILPTIHSAPAAHLSHIGDSAWYCLQHTVKEDVEMKSNDAMTEMSNGVESMNVTDESNSISTDETVWKVIKNSAPVAITQVGQGYLGFVGDMYPSEEANLIMIAMRGLSI
ncbi:hypothetical protein N7450_000358 [Penicillium hetheringtonii]|uniref:Uncharacterized protein n=1 Tax=Penicillium hetheringtonii TaxID=911720 RepID=A0AAD6E2M0_9EURO|nr:hypothetical protein N7450_000358 [Penicillium hetheringtonii]